MCLCLTSGVGPDTQGDDPRRPDALSRRIPPVLPTAVRSGTSPSLLSVPPSDGVGDGSGDFVTLLTPKTG